MIKVLFTITILIILFGCGKKSGSRINLKNRLTILF